MASDIIIGIDCTGETFSAAVQRGQDCLAEISGLSTRAHLQLLFPSIVRAVEQAGLKMADIGAVAVTSGPGSFTGLRLGIVTARTMAQTLGCKLFPVSTLEALAMNAPGFSCVLAGLDARRGEIFGAFFDMSEGMPKRLCPDTAFTPANIGEAMDKYGCRAVVGSCIGRYKATLERSGLVFLPSSLAMIRGSMVALLAADHGKEAGIMELAPEYLRVAEVQVQGYAG